MTKRTFFLLPLLVWTLLGTGSCIRSSHEIKTESEIKPVKIEPIHITIDINVKIDKALDDFFGDIDEANE
ncbi:MAG: YnbE family lipoprotein [Oligosphaeraceae bacterium]|nr:YnbE family lipoprotein [Oligosphaeraceae bacterium]